MQWPYSCKVCTNKITYFSMIGKHEEDKELLRGKFGYLEGNRWNWNVEGSLAHNLYVWKEA